MSDSGFCIQSFTLFASFVVNILLIERDESGVMASDFTFGGAIADKRHP
jgi:hypothetical protein